MRLIRKLFAKQKSKVLNEEMRGLVDSVMGEPYCSILTPYLEKPKDIANLARFAKTYGFFSKDLKKNLLIKTVVCGDEEKAKRLIDANPVLLLEKGATTDYSGRVYKHITAFQAALCAGDVEMCEMMKPYFSQLDNGQELMQKQFNAIFPEGLKAHEATQKRHTFNFDAIFNAINDASKQDLKTALKKGDNGSALCQALKEFRQALTKLSYSERIFNPQHLLAALDAYEKKFDWGHNANWYKLHLFWRQVIGFVQRFLPACDAQAYSQGINNIVDKKKALSRSFVFNKYSYSCRSFYPLNSFNSNSGLGFDYAARGDNGDSIEFQWWMLQRTGRTIRLEISAQITRLMASKNSKLGEFLSSDNSQSSRLFLLAPHRYQ